MYPTLFKIFDEPVSSYFALLIVGFALATWLGVRWAKRSGDVGPSAGRPSSLRPSRSELRRMLVWSELLSPPLALRKEPPGSQI